MKNSGCPSCFLSLQIELSRPFAPEKKEREKKNFFHLFPSSNTIEIREKEKKGYSFAGAKYVAAASYFSISLWQTDKGTSLVQCYRREEVVLSRSDKRQHRTTTMEQREEEEALNELELRASCQISYKQDKGSFSLFSPSCGA